MALTPIARAILDQFTAQAPDWSQVTALDFRAQSAMMVQPADPADRIVSTEADADGVPVTIYRRAEATGAEPTLVFYHGGGYIACSVASHERLCHRLARLAGCAIVSVEYRLAPEHPFPAAIEDALTALRWVAGNEGGHGLDADRIALGGDSAGATIATVTAMRARDARGPRLRHQLLIYPGTDLLAETESKAAFGSGYFLDAGFAELCVSAYLPEGADRAHPWVSPLRAADLEGLPPATLLTAECDPLRDEGRAYAEALREAGVAVEYREYAGMFHGFASMFGVLPEADAALAEAAAALSAAFAPVKA
jgi:acetyl esterase